MGRPSKNKTDTKLKIVGQLLALMKMNDNDVYEMEYAKYLSMLTNYWGEARPANITHVNDCVRIFVIVVSLEKIVATLKYWRWVVHVENILMTQAIVYPYVSINHIGFQ